MHVKCCRIFFFHDRPIYDEHAKATVIELTNGNKELVKENLLLKNENKFLTKMVVKL